MKQRGIGQASGHQGNNKWEAIHLAYGIFLVVAIACFTVPHVSPHDPDAQNLALGATPPSWNHWMGTDLLGRDLFTRIMKGGQVSLMVGLFATAVSVGMGVTAGIAAGWFGGTFDAVMMRSVDILYSLPFTVMVIVLMVAFAKVSQVDSFLLVFVAIGLVEWLTMARIVRGQCLSLKSRTYIQAALSIGQSNLRIFRRHLLPNLKAIIAVQATLTVPSVMLLEAFLSYLGFGVQAPQTSWGRLISEGTSYMEVYPWMLIFPVVTWTMTLVSLNLVGDNLKRAV